MIRIDYRNEGDYVYTTWVHEEFVHEKGDAHSLMGRIVFTKEQFWTFKTDHDRVPMNGIYFEEKK